MSKRILLSSAVALLAVATSACAADVEADTKNVMISADDVPVQIGARREELTDGLKHPWAMVWLPDGRALISERGGKLRIFANGKLQKQTISGLPKLFAQGQGGLLDLSLHPDFANQPYLYFTYAAGDSEANGTVLARGKLSGNRLRDVETLYEVKPRKSGGQHFGSRIAWQADGTLLLSIGDGGNPPLEIDGVLMRDYAQRLSHAYGKVLRLGADGSVPTDNPFVNDAQADPAVFSFGHRNVQGLAVDRDNNVIYATEHGALGGDEFNRLRPAANYGWPVVSHARDYVSGEAIGSKHDEAFVDPLLVWQQAVAPSGLMVYRGALFPDWQGRVFSGSLVKQDVRVITLGEDGRIADERALRIGARVRDVREGPDGAIYVLTDESNGRLFRLAPQI